MVARTIAVGYFGFGFVLALLLLKSNSKKVRVDVVPTEQEEDRVTRYDFTKRQQTAG